MNQFLAMGDSPAACVNQGGVLQVLPFVADRHSYKSWRVEEKQSLAVAAETVSLRSVRTT